MPLKDSTETKRGAVKNNVEVDGQWSDLVLWIVHGRYGVGGSTRVPSWYPWLKEDHKWALANSLMHYLPSTL